MIYENVTSSFRPMSGLDLLAVAAEPAHFKSRRANCPRLSAQVQAPSLAEKSHTEMLSGLRQDINALGLRI